MDHEQLEAWITGLEDGDLTYAMHLLADEVETRMMQRAGEPEYIRGECIQVDPDGTTRPLSREELAALPF